MEQHYFGIKTMIKRIQSPKKEINIDNLTQKELELLIKKIAKKLSIDK